ncbi:hypothetical protein DFQ01_106155 [Paenibacillus cellulosilyticus]|uniref:Uncharacterized protein n=1 Tax=Paenibacillus cellulosilyticus TaxID=375489 RepID=A0A2V2YUS9_9BACL|nr:hypothetical protein DFQ01_106155 [Paenibacillus cellulosilyticus]
MFVVYCYLEFELYRCHHAPWAMRTCTFSGFKSWYLYCKGSFAVCLSLINTGASRIGIWSVNELGNRSAIMSITVKTRTNK